jgi:hypothetical protein
LICCVIRRGLIVSPPMMRQKNATFRVPSCPTSSVMYNLRSILYKQPGKLLFVEILRSYTLLVMLIITIEMPSPTEGCHTELCVTVQSRKSRKSCLGWFERFLLHVIVLLPCACSFTSTWYFSTKKRPSLPMTQCGCGTLLTVSRHIS